MTNRNPSFSGQLGGQWLSPSCDLNPPDHSFEDDHDMFMHIHDASTCDTFLDTSQAPTASSTDWSERNSYGNDSSFRVVEETNEKDEEHLMEIKEEKTLQMMILGHVDEASKDKKGWSHMDSWEKRDEQAFCCEGGYETRKEEAVDNISDSNQNINKRKKDRKRQSYKRHLKSSRIVSLTEDMSAIPLMNSLTDQELGRQAYQFQSVIKKLVKKSEERNKKLQIKCEELEKTLEAQNEVVRMIPILTSHCKELQRVVKEQENVIEMLKEEKSQKKFPVASFRLQSRNKKPSTLKFNSSSSSVVSALTYDY
eukprot:CAMPEP_0183295920 /NCGR_PEP_ID=MMETSP0160_2-20130417/3687_1 /TAXON_ID=2839 ORGANISM="Odontella Sinensis, Strain Grunow 1884" /NCGR_SAMPLE_ID=MMETSP0160_2 /ASSEMBLY_ACC=CAM_ASM_000250 /LENGTH=309 /DNA_ID=CAMNT_0025457461 /DNA_START=19 /DNA_END=948 /DNA_ORIENTATION=+